MCLADCFVATSKNVILQQTPHILLSDLFTTKYVIRMKIRETASIRPSVLTDFCGIW